MMIVFYIFLNLGALASNKEQEIQALNTQKNRLFIHQGALVIKIQEKETLIKNLETFCKDHCNASFKSNRHQSDIGRIQNIKKELSNQISELGRIETQISNINNQIQKLKGGSKGV